MKVMTLLIMLAMLCMVVEGCSRRAVDGTTAGRQIDAAIDRNMPAITIPKASDFQTIAFEPAMSSMARSISDNAIVSTLAIDDSVISATIQRELRRAPDLQGTKVEVDTNDGVVSLNGMAIDEEGRARAAQIARGGRGVVRVENNIEVVADR